MRKFIVIILAIFLSGCASLIQRAAPPPPPRAKIVSHYLPWAQRKVQLNALQNFRANGNLAVHATSGRGVNASFSWEQHHHTYQLSFFGPLGTQSTVLTGNPSQVCLTTHQQTYTAQNPERLLQDQLGLNLPVSQLYYWLRGLPAPQSRYTTNLDAFNRIMQLRQSGWRVIYKHFTNLPDRIEMSNCQWQVRIVINHWDI
jgi:outer membrane lipoprotein LolB